MRSILLLTASLPAIAATTAPAGPEFFETHIRPLLVANCFSCHTSTHLGDLRLDSRDAMLKGGKSGPALTPGEPDKSLLIQAVRQTNPKLKMPMGGRLTDNEVEDLVAWVKAGAVWPAAAAPVIAPKTGGEYVIRPDQRAFWSFQPLHKPEVPAVSNAGWPKTDIDRFVLARLPPHNPQP